MADKEVKIRIDTDADTSGAKQTEQALDQVSASAQKANAQSANLAKSTNTSANGFKSMGTGVQNVSFQLQDFAVQVGSGTSAMRAFSQQAPQLLSAFGPYGAVAGAFIALAPIIINAFAGGEQGAKKAAEEAEKYAAVVDALAEVFERFSKERRESIERGSDNNAKRLSDLSKEQQANQAILNLETEREKRRIQADGNLEIARGRLTLALQEKQLATSTGETALRLARDIEATKQRILEKEREIAELVRQQDAKAAQQKVADAGKARESATADEDFAIRQQRDAAVAMESNTATLIKEREKREESIRLIEQQIEKLKQELVDNQDTVGSGPENARRMREIEELKKQRDEAAKPSQAEADADSKRDSLTKEFNAATEARIKASVAATEADNTHARLQNEANQLLENQKQERETAVNQSAFNAQSDFATGKQQVADDLAAKVGNFLQSINLPAPEQNSGVRYFLDQLAALAEGGIDSTERQAAEAAMQKIIGLSNSSTGEKAALFQNVSTTFESANKADAKLAEILERQNGINDEYRRRLETIEGAMRNPNH
jgi:hypothetical protein